MSGRLTEAVGVRVVAGFDRIQLPGAHESPPPKPPPMSGVLEGSKDAPWKPEQRWGDLARQGLADLGAGADPATREERPPLAEGGADASGGSSAREEEAPAAEEGGS